MFSELMGTSFGTNSSNGKFFTFPRFTGLYRVHLFRFFPDLWSCFAENFPDSWVELLDPELCTIETYITPPDKWPCFKRPEQWLIIR